ncbi:MAG: pilus assembly protein PilM [Candidatus Omnitrophota bacterium]
MPTLIGIDIGSRYVKVVEFEPGLKLRLINAFLFETPILSAEEESPLVRLDTGQFQNQLSRVIPLKRLKVAKIGVNLPSEAINIMFSLLPKMSKRELDTAAVAEAKRKMIPVSHPSNVFEYLILGERIVAKIPRYEITVVRADKIDIENRLRLFKDVAPEMISPPCYAILNVLKKDFWPEEDVAFVDLGYQSISVSIARGGKLFLYRNIVFGFKDIIFDIARQLGITDQKAEQAIREKGIPEVAFDLRDRVAIAEEIMRQKYKATETKGAAEAEVNLLELRMRWQSAIDRIIQELRRSFAYYKEQSEGRRVEHIYFLGGGSRFTGLIPALSKEIGGQCRILTLFRDTEVSLRSSQFEDIIQESPVFATASGLALGTLPKKKEKIINFLPPELKTKEVVTFRYTILILITLFFIFGLFVGWLNKLFTWRSVRISLGREESKLNRIEMLTKDYQSITEHKRRLDENTRILREIIQQTPQFKFVLYDISRVMPSDMVLTQMVIKAKGVSFEKQERAGAEGRVEGGSAFEEPAMSAERREQRMEVAGSERDEYTLEIKGQIIADYERALQMIEHFSKSLQGLSYIKDIQVKPPELEKISPKRVPGQEGLSLTEVKNRRFSLSARLQLK